MRQTSSVTSLSWIPSEAIGGVNRAAFASGFVHYDEPPPDRIEDLEELRAADRFRFANRLEAWVEIDDGQIVDAGYSGGIVMGSTTVALGVRSVVFAAVSLPEIRRPVELDAAAARFVQTVGGHTGLPAPRHVSRAPFLKFEAPTVWTTLALTIRSDGTSDYELIGASPFPRHWIYDAEGVLCAKAGLTDFKQWWRRSFGTATPWGDEESPALVTAVETALERDLAGLVMHGDRRPAIRTVEPGATLTEQGAPGDEVFLLLNGVLRVEVDGESVAEVGPGAILGERAGLEGAVRTSTLRAITPAKVAAVAADRLSTAALTELSAGHRREDERHPAGNSTTG